MLVTLITHPGDRDLTVNLCARIQQLGGVQNHECLIVSPHGTNMDSIENVLKRCFGSVFIHQYADSMKGWPAGPNEAAAHAMLHCWTNNALRYHYLMLEPDCVPTREHWLDVIDIAYRQASPSGTHVLGVKTDTRNAQGAVIGRHTVGVAVYPKAWPEFCPPVKSMIEMSNGYRQQGHMPPPWDAYCGPYTNRCTVETPVIQHFNLQPVAEGGFHWDCSVESALQQVSPKAVLVHGCKHPEFLSRLTGLKPQPVIPAVPPKERVSEALQRASEKHSALTVKELVSLDAQIHKEIKEGNQRQQETVAVHPAEAKRLAELNAFKWGKLKKHANALGVQVHRVSRPDITLNILATEKKQRTESWTKKLPEVPEAAPVVEPPLDVPVEEAAPPLVAPPISTAVRTAISWNSDDGKEKSPFPPEGEDSKFSDPMKKAMMELIAKRRAAGLA